MLCRGRCEISFTVLLVNYHDVTGRIFDPGISRQTGMKSPLKWHNQPGRKKINNKGLLVPVWREIHRSNNKLISLSGNHRKLQIIRRRLTA